MERKRLATWRKKVTVRGLVACLLIFAVGRAACSAWTQALLPAVSLSGSSGDRSGAGQAEGFAEYRELPKQIAITFDDGPNPIYTQKLLDGLKKRDVKASFFLLGKEVELYPEIVKKIKEDGHLIGVHSYEHVNFTQIGNDAAVEQIRKTGNAIEAVTGENPGFIRPPYGCWKKSLHDRVPMIEVLWDVDPLDWATTSADSVTQRILKAVDKGGTIILLHDASASSVQAALAVIDALTEQGYEFVTVEELLLE